MTRLSISLHFSLRHHRSERRGHFLFLFFSGRLLLNELLPGLRYLVKLDLGCVQLELVHHLVVFLSVTVPNILRHFRIIRFVDNGRLARLEDRIIEASDD